MSETVLKVENLSKQYRLGTVGTGTISHDLNRWWHKIRGKEDPYLKIGETNNRSTKGESEYVWALKDINFEVKQGEVLGIIGKNGAGKSTLLKILSKVTGPTTGQIKAKGRIASLLEVGTGFHPELTGGENIYLNGAILGMTRLEIKKKFDEIVDFAGVERYINTPVKRYSSGMYVRLAFAVTAFLEPEILVVDEVLAVGDAEFQKKALGKMQDVSHISGRTILFVSHNMAAVKALCPQSMFLQDGEFVSKGDTDSILKLYLSNNTSQTTSSVSSTENITREKGLQKVIKKVWIENENGEKVTDVFMGGPMTICFAFESQNNMIEPIFGFGIDNMLGERIFSYNNLFGAKLELDSATKGIARLKISDSYLLPDKYQITVSIVQKHMEVIDYVTRAHSFIILPFDIYGSGKIPQKSQGLYYIKGDLDVEEIY